MFISDVTRLQKLDTVCSKMNRSIQLEIDNVSQLVTSNIFELEVTAFYN